MHEDDGKLPLVKVIEPRVSYADLERAPEDGRRYELYDGEAVVVPSPNLGHQDAATNIFELLHAYARQHGGKALIAPIDIVFSEFDVLQPDVAFFRGPRRHLLRRDQPVRSAPDLVVEILAPGTERTDRGRKMQAYARFGVPEYWVVDPTATTVEVLRLSEGRFALEQSAQRGDTVRSATLPDLQFPATDTFAE